LRQVHGEWQARCAHRAFGGANRSDDQADLAAPQCRIALPIFVATAPMRADFAGNLACALLPRRASQLVDAVVVESLIQAVSSAAFFVPGGLAVQEGSFVLIGGAPGLDPSICLALAGARRIRDLVIFIPGLLAWQLAESSNRLAARPTQPG